MLLLLTITADFYTFLQYPGPVAVALASLKLLMADEDIQFEKVDS